MRNIFDKIGENDITELYKHIRVGMIQSVDTVKATVVIEWLDKSGARIEVPIPMPFCEQGWGIYAMPYKYSLVLCDVRTYELPVILAYVPPNFISDDKAWGKFKKVSSFPKHKDGSEFDSGEVIVRNLIGEAKCKVCKKISTIDAWAATYAYNNVNDRIKMEHCPSCDAPAFVMSPNGEITTVNKIQLGILMYLQKDGKLSIRINDGLSKADGDTFESGSLITLEFDENSNLVVDGIQDLTLKAINTTTNIEEDEIVTSKNTTRNIDENEVITSKDSHETTDHKLIESDNIELGDTSAITIGQAKGIITVLKRLIQELTSHVHTGNLGSPTSPPTAPFTEPQQSEIETTKTKAS